MFLNAEFRKYAELADDFVTQFIPSTSRTSTCFPPPAGSHDYIKVSPYCCGLAELTTHQNPSLPIFTDHVQQDEVISKMNSWAEKNKLPDVVLQLAPSPFNSQHTVLTHTLEYVKLHFAYLLNTSLWLGQGGSFGGKGFLIYCAPEGVNGYYKPFIQVITAFGFTPLLKFPNPNHAGRLVTMWGCHTIKSEPYKDKAWVNSSVLNLVANVDQETMLESGTTENTALDAIGLTQTTSPPSVPGSKTLPNTRVLTGKVSRSRMTST